MYNESKYAEILNNHFVEYNNNMLVKIAAGNFNRIVSDFQILPFEDKLKQNIYTSVNIVCGQAMEDIVKEFLKDNGAIFLPRNIVTSKDCDQVFQFNNKTILIEQKMRDDHDSSKKVGQVQNFLEKKDFLNKHYNNVLACSWFIDSSFKKNYKYYAEQIPGELKYGSEIEDFLKEVFGDNRCDGLTDSLKQTIASFRKNLNFTEAFQHLTFDYKNEEITIPHLANVLMNITYKKEIKKYFFNDYIPYEEIISYLLTKRQTKNVKELIEYLRKENNNE